MTTPTQDVLALLDATVREAERVVTTMRAARDVVAEEGDEMVGLRATVEASVKRVRELEVRVVELEAVVVEMEAKALVLEEKNAQLNGHLETQEEVVVSALGHAQLAEKENDPPPPVVEENDPPPLTAEENDLPPVVVDLLD